MYIVKFKGVESISKSMVARALEIGKTYLGHSSEDHQDPESVVHQYIPRDRSSNHTDYYAVSLFLDYVMIVSYVHVYFLIGAFVQVDYLHTFDVEMRKLDDDTKICLDTIVKNDRREFLFCGFIPGMAMFKNVWNGYYNGHREIMYV